MPFLGWGARDQLLVWQGILKQGIITQSLGIFLDVMHVRPLYARVAKDNIASISVLEKNSFERLGEG